MTDQPFFTPGLKIAPRQSTAGEFVWTLRKDGRALTCEFREHLDVGCEVQVLLDGELYFGRLHQTRELAEADAADRRRQAEAKGWTEA